MADKDSRRNAFIAEDWKRPRGGGEWCQPYHSARGRLVVFSGARALISSFERVLRQQSQRRLACHRDRGTIAEPRSFGQMAQHAKSRQGSARASTEALQKQLDEFAPAVLGKLRKESDRLLEGLREGLEQAAREFQGKSTEAIREKLQTLTEEFVETSAAQLHKHADQNLELLTEQLRSKQQQVAAEAENLFRNTIANMLKMVMQPGFQKIAEQESPEGEETKKRR